MYLFRSNKGQEKHRANKSTMAAAAVTAVLDKLTAAPGFLSDIPPPTPFRSVTKRKPGGKSCGLIAVATAAAAMVALLFI